MGVHTETPGPNDIVNSAQAEQAAGDAEARPEVRRWMARLKRLVKDTPEGLEVYVGETVAVLARGPNEEHFMTEFGGSDTAAVIDSFNNNRWDGGAW